jgi:hypothetical protein
LGRLANVCIAYIQVIGHFKETETMTRIITILIIILLTTFNSFGQADTIFKKADHYKTKNFDVAIFPATILALFQEKDLPQQNRKLIKLKMH